MISLSDACPCGKSKSYGDCCHCFITGKKLPKTPEQLMRSRYTAYALGGHGDYLLRTWFPFTARDLTAEQLSERKQHWTHLQVLNKRQDGDEGTVEFKAFYTDNDKEQVLHEISEFKRVAGVWLYIGGRVK